jgi:hypothetical protein
MTTPKAASFAHRALATATRLEIAYRDAKRLSQDWYANNHAAGIPFDTEPLDDGNATLPINGPHGVLARLQVMRHDGTPAPNWDEVLTWL